MYKPFDELSDNARIWIYQLEKPLNEKEFGWLEQQLVMFCDSWQAHGAPLLSSYQVRYNRFVILAVDETVGGASGCSIDGSVHKLQEISSKLQVDFFDRTKIAFQLSGEVEVFPLSKLKDLFASGVLKATDNTFNNLVASKGELKTNWEIPVSESWLAKYLPKSTLA